MPVHLRMQVHSRSGAEWMAEPSQASVGPLESPEPQKQAPGEQEGRAGAPRP